MRHVPSPVPQLANPGKAEKHGTALRRAADSFPLPGDADPQNAGYGAGERHRHRRLDRHLLRQCRAHDQDLRALGIDLDPEFEEVLPGDPHLHGAPKGLAQAYRQLFRIFEEMGLQPMPMPKMGDFTRCKSCGRCMFGCPEGVKWDSRQFLDAAVAKGAELITGCSVESVEIEDGRAAGVWARQGLIHHFYPADLVILAAGGFATPAILDESGIPCPSGPHLFVDPVLTVAADWPGSHQCREVEMPFVAQRPGYILSPYFDFLSFFFNDEWKHPARDILGIMIKLAESNEGSVTRHGVQKTLTDTDKERLVAAQGVATEILCRLGAKEEDLFLGTINAGHPGGSLPLTEREAGSLHHERLPSQPLRRRRQPAAALPGQPAHPDHHRARQAGERARQTGERLSALAGRAALCR